ncbi:MAG: prepilin-type N-terminal cleavage/methylation domain-containing protein [Schleiferilactobacillus perolens]|jgi:prepilin-type N-terminal cleavage/methylation domain-containing protein
MLRREGFTLLETLVVLVCVCTVALLAVSNVHQLGEAITMRSFIDRFKTTYAQYENKARVFKRDYVAKNQAGKWISFGTISGHESTILSVPSGMSVSVPAQELNITAERIDAATWTFNHHRLNQKIIVTVQLGWGRLLEAKATSVSTR